MPWRERFRDYLAKDKDSLERRLAFFESGQCELWETHEGERRNVTEEYSAGLRSRIAEIEQLLVEEGLS